LVGDWLVHSDGTGRIVDRASVAVQLPAMNNRQNSGPTNEKRALTEGASFKIDQGS
jgi:hypothetical protein